MSTMNIIQVTSEDQLGVEAADFFANFIRNFDGKPNVILPTGFTPLPFYKEIVKRYQNGETYLGNFRYLALDEYLDIPNGDHRSFAAWLGREILDPLNISVDERIVFNSACTNTDAECKRIAQAVKEAGGIDLAIVGIGGNGHIGFNEPGSSFDLEAQRIDLTKETRIANAEYWGCLDKVPRQAITLGIGTLKHANQTLMLATGARKAAALSKTLHGEVCVDVPSTYLQQQGNVTIIADHDALSVKA